MELRWEINEDGCWICTSKHSRSNDGHVRYSKKWHFAHRYMFAKYNGDIPKGMVVRHKCDIPECLNPDHLELGTHADNVSDRVKRGRSATGSKNGRSKLTEFDVREIRSSNSSGIELSRIYGVDPKVISNVRNYKTWKHVL